VAFASITSQSESGGRDYYPGGSPVVSPKGAKYAMQVMPSTARAPGFGVKPAQGDNPGEYNRVGREYLDVLRQRYGGDPAKMWGAYNWGPGNLDAALQKYGADWLQYAPPETQAYVKNNLLRAGGM
jgi:soluble lytic murein transglycosylase